MTLRNLVLLSTMISNLSFAGDSKGNGGDVVVCRDKQGLIKSIELLDFYEAEQIWNIKYKFKESTLPAKVEETLRKLQIRDNYRANLYRNHVKTFFQEAIFKPGVQLVDIPDSNHLAFPKGCTVEQIVIQREPQFAQDRRYLVNQDLWDLLDDDNKAGVLLHEVIFRNALEEKATNSRGTRYLNALITSDEIAKVTSTESYLTILNQAKFESYQHPSGVFLFAKCGIQTFYTNGEIHEGCVSSGTTSIGKKPFDISRGTIIFYETGQVKAASFYDGLLLIGKNYYQVTNSSGHPFSAEWYKNGVVKSVYLATHIEQLAQELKTLGLEPSYRVEFYLSGKIRTATTAVSKIWKTSSGPHSIVRGTKIELDEAGIVIKW